MIESERILKEVNEKIDKICEVLGIGKVPPAKIIDLKERAKQKAERLKSQEKVIK